ncbi:Hypothetical predicted protein [Prunus dulcis]|uniref:Uncharacterized protein n=1 Tax=Prunus dulcis TaxID=3755 RepID=A0A5E4FV32_PRUDU|nr:Hypothetical predicted protein [Prunus dulcis]
MRERTKVNAMRSGVVGFVLTRRIAWAIGALKGKDSKQINASCSLSRWRAMVQQWIVFRLEGPQRKHKTPQDDRAREGLM